MKVMKGRRYDKRDIKVTYIESDVFTKELKPKD